MKCNLVRNDETGDIGFFYGEDLGFAPEWAAIDVERGELSVYDNNDRSRMIMIEGMKDDIYQKLKEQRQILLVQVKDNIITDPVKAFWANLMIPQQI